MMKECQSRNDLLDFPKDIPIIDPENTNVNIFAQRIKEQRLKYGFTQQQTAEMIGLTGNSIIEIEKGRNKTTLDNAVKLAELFGVSLDYLVGRDSPANTQNKITEESLCPKP
jgi:transcriptional regulator with XRE-family HTH domain